MSSTPPVNPAAAGGFLAPVRGDPPSAIRQKPNVSGVKAEFVTSRVERQVPTVHDAAEFARAKVEAAAEKIQSFAASLGQGVRFVVDSSTGKAIVRVMDPQTNETIRQIPPEESLRLARMVDYLASLLVDQRT